MPRTPSSSAGNGTKRPSFRARYDNLERQRAQLLERLHVLGERARQHPGHARALTLLNTSFRKATLAQRAAVLQAASFLIDIIDKWIVLL
jgi:hypothetical protein